MPVHAVAPQAVHTARPYPVRHTVATPYGTPRTVWCAPGDRGNGGGAVTLTLTLTLALTLTLTLTKATEGTAEERAVLERAGRRLDELANPNPTLNPNPNPNP